MAANLMEDKIMESIYESNKNWVSVEVVLNKSLTPSELFNLTEKQAGDRFYLRLNDNMSSFFGYHAIQRFKNNFENKQSIFREWEKFKNDVELIHVNTQKHHLKIVGDSNFQIISLMMSGVNLGLIILWYLKYLFLQLTIKPF